MSSAAAWRAMSYGYAPIWWLTIAGVPVVWTERDTGRTNPAAFAAAQTAALVLDDAPIGIDQIDRDRGIAAGLPLGFKLLDCATLSTYLRRWTRATALAADLDATDTVAEVETVTGWPASGVIYVGQEAIAYSGTTTSPTPRFTGLTRARYGTLASTHKVGTTGQVVTDLPRYWAGREVRLYAAFADPSGHVCGTALADQSVEVWRGRLEGMPVRDGDGWRLSAYALDRVLDVQLPALLSGTVSTQQALYPADPTLAIAITVNGYGNSSALLWGYYAVLRPFAALAYGAPLTASEARAAITAAWDAFLVAESITELGTLEWPTVEGNPASKSFCEPRLVIPDDPNLKRVQSIAKWPDGKAVGAKTTWGGQEPDDATHSLGIRTNLFGTARYSTKGQTTQTMPPALVVVPDGDASTVVAPGLVRVTAGNLSGIYAYTNADTTGGDVLLWPLAKQSGDDLDEQDLADAEAEILGELSGSWHDAVLTVMQSSGTGLRGAYDTLAASRGYGLPDSAIADGSFAVLGDAPAVTLGCIASTSGASVPDVFGGLLALSRLAIACQPQDAANTPVKLELVRTSPGGQPVVTITDADLIAHAQEPVVSVSRAEAANAVTLTPAPAGDDLPPVHYHDRASQEALGIIAADWTIPTPDRDALIEMATPLIASQFASDQTAMAVQLLVHPGCPARVGDGVWLALTHPALWSWSTGAAGYDGPGRVVGRTIDPDSCVVTLRILIDGVVTTYPLCPSAEVIARDSGTAPTWIDIPLAYLDHMQAALDGVASIRLDAYDPGATESTGKYHTVTAAAESGGYCRLTVSGTTGGHTLTAGVSHLTLPPSAAANTYQSRHAHADDGTSWG